VERLGEVSPKALLSESWQKCTNMSGCRSGYARGEASWTRLDVLSHGYKESETSQRGFRGPLTSSLCFPLWVTLTTKLALESYHTDEGAALVGKHSS
jgi:hypothetical protein